MPDLSGQIELFLDELRRQNASDHTVRNYASDLDQFLAYFSIPGQTNPAVEQIDALAIREWLGHLYQQRLTAVSMRRKLAAVRSFFKFLLREGLVEKNVARMVRTPKAPKTLPAVMTAEQTNALVDGVTPAADKFERPLSGARSGDLRIAVRLRAAHQRTGGLESGRFRFQRTLDSGARQG